MIQLCDGALTPGRALLMMWLQMVGTRPPPSRESVRTGLNDEDSAIMRAMSPLGGARRRRSSTAASYDLDRLSRPDSRGHSDMPDVPEEGSDSTLGEHGGRRRIRSGRQQAGDLTVSNLEDSETDSEDMDPEIRHVLRKMEANLAGKDVEDDAVSLGSSLGSDYEFQDMDAAGGATAAQQAAAGAK